MAGLKLYKYETQEQLLSLSKLLSYKRLFVAPSRPREKLDNTLSNEPETRPFRRVNSLLISSNADSGIMEYKDQVVGISERAL